MTPSHKSQRTYGLGDAVEAVAKPVARALGIENCAPCLRRKARLNAMSDHVAVRVRRIFSKRD